MGAVNIAGPNQMRSPSSSFHPWKGPALYLRTGDTIACEVKKIDDFGITFHSPQFDATFVPHNKVKAVELERSQATKIDPSKRDRLLTLPRMQKEDPPTHLIRSTEGDYLRGRLVEMDDKTLTVEVRAGNAPRRRDHVASIIWLEKQGSKEQGSKEQGSKEPPRGYPAGSKQEATRQAPSYPLSARVQSLGSDGVRLIFRPEKLAGTTLRGTSDVLGGVPSGIE